MAERNYYYEKYDENYEKKTCPIDDKDGKITGKIILNVIAYFDENPEERKRLGWIKHIEVNTKDIEYNRQTQFLVKGIRQIDEYTVIDEYRVLDTRDRKSTL